MASNRNNEIRNYTRRNGEQVIELVTKREAFDAAFDGELNDMGNYHHDISTIFESVYIWDVNGKCYSADDAELPAKKDIVAIDNAEWGIVWVSNRASDKVVEDINAGYEVQIQYAIEDDENEAEMEAEKAAKEANEIEAIETVEAVETVEAHHKPATARHREHTHKCLQLALFGDLGLDGVDTQVVTENAHNGQIDADNRHSRIESVNTTTQPQEEIMQKYIIEIEDINTSSGDMWTYGEYETIDEASKHMQRAIDATQAEYDARLKETCKPCVWAFITRVTLDDEGEWIGQESIDGAKLRHSCKTIWRVKARAYTTYRDGEIIEDTLPANASAEQLSIYVKDGYLTYDAIEESSQVVGTSDWDDSKVFELANGGRIKHVWGYATGSQIGEHNEHGTFSHVVLLDDEGETLESYPVDFDFTAEDEPTSEDWQALEDAGTRAILAHFVA